MIIRKLSLVFGILFVFTFGNRLRAQTNCIAIAINEYCASNIPANGYADAYGEFTDWVELKCNFTSNVSLAGYYLSNDRNNLYKWAFPSSFVMAPGGLKLIFLSGRNTVKNGEYHANFTLEQCRNQWLIVSTSTGVIRDSVFVRPTKGGHSWGRIDCFTTGIGAFKLFQGPAKSPGADNGTIYSQMYAPTPKLVTQATPVSEFTAAGSKGGFYQETQLGFFKLNGRTYDTATTCYDIFYTTDGTTPVPGYPPSFPTVRYFDSVSTVVTIDKTTMIRSIAAPRKSNACGPGTGILNSFIESDTYFIDPTHQTFDTAFGIVSIALEDPTWLLPNGGTTSQTIHVEYYDRKNHITEGYGIINRPPQESWLTEQKGFYISIDDRFGSGCNWEGDIFNVEGLGTTPRRVFPQLHLKAGDFESHSEALAIGTNTSFGTGLRDVFIQSIAAKNNLHVSPLHIKPVIAFMNGEYSGVFDLREIFDKYYENFYNGQAMDSLDMNFVHLLEGNVNYWDNTISTTVYNDWNTGVYKLATENPLNAGPGKKNAKYEELMSKLDKESFIDYMILNSFAQNQDLFEYNVGFARGHDKSKPGYKWHYYLWNCPSTFNFTMLSNQNTPKYTSPATAPCYIHTGTYSVQPRAYDGHGNILTMLMGNWPGKTSWGNDAFKLEYKNRYQDLMNGPLKCENLMKHYEWLVNLYAKEMHCHEDASCEPLGDYHTQKDIWDTNTTVLRKALQARCYTLENQFSKGNCYGQQGPFDLTVNVEPQGAGKVKLNSVILENYVWTGKYYQTTLSFKAIPTSTAYAFHHWDIKGPISKDPLSLDSIGLNFNTQGEVVAVFTDKRNEIIPTGGDANVPSGFTPNGDGNNDIFRPLGASEYVSEFQMTIWNRWGQEVFRSVDPLVGWDGNYKSGMSPTGVYAYVITYRNIYGEAKVVKGNVTLTR
jgi:gliding motility-associated-like protein